jgi:hypothetical protein
MRQTITGTVAAPRTIFFITALSQDCMHFKGFLPAKKLCSNRVAKIVDVFDAGSLLLTQSRTDLIVALRDYSRHQGPCLFIFKSVNSSWQPSLYRLDGHLAALVTKFEAR